MIEVKRNNKRILVVDDEPDIADMVKSRLESNGYSVEVVYTGEEGLKKMKQEQPDLIVLDVILPGISGYEVCRRIKIDDDSSIPVVMLTSRNQAVDERLGYLCKADSYIRKPMSSELLVPEIRRLLKETKEVKG